MKIKPSHAIPGADRCGHRTRPGHLRDADGDVRGTAAGLGADAGARRGCSVPCRWGWPRGCSPPGCSATTSAGDGCTWRGSPCSRPAGSAAPRKGAGGFVGARILEGLGGAAILACGLAILANDFPRRDAGAMPPRYGDQRRRRHHARCVLSAGLGTARWRESYLAVGALAVILLWPSVSRIRDSRAANRRQLDLAGLVLFATAMTLMVCALTLGRDGIDIITAILATGRRGGAGRLRVVERGSATRSSNSTVAPPPVSRRYDRLHALGAGITSMVRSCRPWSRLAWAPGCGPPRFSSSRGRVPASRRRCS